MDKLRLLSFPDPENAGEPRSQEELSREAIARRFYGDLLGGRQVWPSGARAGIGIVWFLFGETLVEAGANGEEAREAVTVEVESPNETAARCWDAGFTVQLASEGNPGALSVIDPFGRPIALVQRSDAVEIRDAG